jgi:membrane protease YdiL (CAAX protease family)
MGADVTVGLAAVALVAAHNLFVERLPAWAYVPAGLATTAALLALAGGVGIGPAEVGLSAADLPDGLVVGGAAALVVGGAIVVAARARPTRAFFADQRMAGVGPAGTAYRALVRIPLGTVVLEEVAFRGVLVAIVAEATSVAAGVIVASVLFGLWHLVPTAATLDRNGVATPARARALALVGAVLFTAVTGLVFCWLRLATNSLAAPALVHASANVTATIAAFAVLRRSAPAPTPASEAVPAAG